MAVTHQHHHIDYVEFPLADAAAVAASKAFFGQAFGWTYQDWGDTYADTSGSGVGSGLNADREHRPQSPLVVVFTHDLDDTRAKVMAAGATITREIFAFPGGRRFHFREPGGNELAVWAES
ncbi:MAG: VOC family protein [Proteobacteria bacterium]|nr:VOC family protein [Pseudomonadota bacterium]